jgi:hypothetical protein
MVSFILVLCGCTIFIRVYINKYEMKHKDLISIALATSLTAFLTLIQFVVNLILNIFI